MRQEAGLSQDGLSCGVGYTEDPVTGFCEEILCGPEQEVHPRKNVCVDNCVPDLGCDYRTGECRTP